MQRRKNCLGIDLGTTNSTVFIAESSNSSRCVLDGNHIPSCICFPDKKKDSNTIDIGSDPTSKDEVAGRVVRQFKLLFGLKYNEKDAKTWQKRFLAKLTKDKDGYYAFDIPSQGVVTIQTLYELMISDFYKKALKANGDLPFLEVRLTYPAEYSQDQIALLRCAAENVIKDSPVKVISEPTAAAICYTLVHTNKTGIFVIYDLGGGTFDVSIIRVSSDGRYEVLGHSGSKDIGGCTFDMKIFKWLESKYKEDAAERLDVDKEELSLLLREEDEFTKEDIQQSKKMLLKECETAKEALTLESEVDIDVSEYFAKLFKYLDKQEGSEEDEANIENEYSYLISRTTFEQLIRQEIEETIDITLECIRNNGFSIDNINRVLLVGGSSRIPLVKKRLEEVFGSYRVGEDIDYRICVAQGASLRGHNSFVITDYTKNAICNWNGRRYKELIPAGERLPYSTTLPLIHISQNTGSKQFPLYEQMRGGKYQRLKRFDLDENKITDMDYTLKIWLKIDEDGEMVISFYKTDSNGEKDELIQTSRHNIYH